MINSDILSFLTQLKKHNNKPWFEENKSRYLIARADFTELVTDILEKFPSVDSEIKELRPNDCLFRIYRDVRFSKNKTPYKINMSAAFHKGGKKSGYGGYYIHIQPGGNSFIGGGIWSPPPEDVKKIRQEIDYNFDEFKKIISNKKFISIFGELEKEKGQVLVNLPKGYEKDNPAAEFLKLKSWVVSKNFSDAELLKSNFLKEIMSAFQALKPFIHFLNRSLD